MAVINLTPHSVEVYADDQFVGLEQTNPTTWVADGVEGDPIAAYHSQGLSRINTSTVEVEMAKSGLGFEVVRTQYGEATGIPENAKSTDVLIVSLPMKSMSVASGHPLSDSMVSPYKVVRSRANGSLVLGCMGFTY